MHIHHSSACDGPNHKIRFFPYYVRDIVYRYIEVIDGYHIFEMRAEGVY